MHDRRAEAGVRFEKFVCVRAGLRRGMRTNFSFFLDFLLLSSYYDYINMTTKGIYEKMNAADFKSKCLKVMDNVAIYHQEVVITKHGKPVAKLVPFSEKPSGSVFGYLKESVKTKGDITKPLDEAWEADQ